MTTIYAITKASSPVASRAVNTSYVAAANEVLYVGELGPAVDTTLNPTIAGVPCVWDAGLNTIRAMTAAEIAAVPAQQKTARDAANPDLATLRDTQAASVTTNNTYVALSAPSTAQNTAQIKVLTQQNTRLLKAVAALIVKAGIT